MLFIDNKAKFLQSVCKAIWLVAGKEVHLRLDLLHGAGGEGQVLLRGAVG